MLHNFTAKTPIESAMPERLLGILRTRGYQLQKMHLVTSGDCLLFTIHCTSNRSIDNLFTWLKKVPGLQLEESSTG